MKKLKILKLRHRYKHITVKRVIFDEPENSDSQKIFVTGGECKAFGIWDFPIPTGYCGNPYSDEIDEVVRKDKLGQLLNNPIDKCIFYLSKKGYCMFGGDCDKRTPISDDELNEYKRIATEEIERKYGPRPGGI